MHSALVLCHPFVTNLVSLCLAALNSCALNNGGCEHDCVQVTLAQHRCQCRHNHQLHEDGKRCVRESLGGWGAIASSWEPRDGDAQMSDRSDWGISSKNSVCFVVMDVSCGFFQGMGRAGGVWPTKMKLCEGAGCCESGGTAERGSGVGSSPSLADLLLAQEGEKLKGTERKVVLIHSSWHSRGRKEGSP